MCVCVCACVRAYVHVCVLLHVLGTCKDMELHQFKHTESDWHRTV